ncbi:MAG: reverse transcriptase N-terminal domain-containing protein [Xenococcaceae cyanobacterium MO_207.B15]|nr:reverse transcriptase N-terminal domain-containing protein [Xenococcaceae cyanobacterium MO_207.B15]
MNKPNTDSKLNTVGWNDINWRKVERYVFKLQKRIYAASRRGETNKVRKLQKTLMNSWSCKVLAVRRVTQENRGKKTAGVDGVKCLSPETRLLLAGQLKLTGKSKPTRRVWIPKPGRKGAFKLSDWLRNINQGLLKPPSRDEKRCSAVLDGAFKHLNQVQVSAPWLSPMSDCIKKRPLGIPTIHDRALQGVVKAALEPEWEAIFEPNSYGFRPGRSCQDAIWTIKNAIQAKAKYVLDADIAKCFHRINHSALLQKLNHKGKVRRQIKAWLSSGVIDQGVFTAITEGGNGGQIQKD